MLFKKTTVDSIIADFRTKVGALLAHSEKKRDERDAKHDQADVLIREADAADAEAIRAEEVAAKIANLIG